MKVVVKNPDVRKDLTLTISVNGSYNDKIEIKVEKEGGSSWNGYHVLEVCQE